MNGRTLTATLEVPNLPRPVRRVLFELAVMSDLGQPFMCFRDLVNPCQMPEGEIGRYRRPDGRKACRKCHVIRSKGYRTRKKAR